MDQSSISQNRKSRRSNVLFAATLEAGGRSLPVRLRNLSSEGALVKGARLPRTGAEILFRRNELSVPGRVAWVDGEQAGIAFAEPLKAEDVLRNVPSPKPRGSTLYKPPGFSVRLTD